MKKHIVTIVSSLVLIASMLFATPAHAETVDSWLSEAKVITESALKTAESDNFDDNAAFIGSVEKFQRKAFLATPASPEETDLIKKACAAVAKAAIVVKENLERNISEDSEVLVGLQEQMKLKKGQDSELLESSISIRTFNVKQYGTYQKRLEAVMKKLTDQSK